MTWVKGELLTDLNALGLDPNRRLDRENQSDLFARLDWFHRVWRHFPSKAASPIIMRAWSERCSVWLFLARLDADRFVSLSNWYSFSFGPVFGGKPGDEKKLALMTAVARRLRSRRWQAGEITMSPIAAENGVAALLVKAFRKSGWVVFIDQASTSWTTNVANTTFEQYWNARPGNLRTTFKRKHSKAKFETQIFSAFDADAWDEYEAVYDDSWKPKEGSPDFVRDAAEQDGECGLLRLGVCRVDGVAIAAQYWTVDARTAYIHKLAYREGAKDLSPGTILSHAMFRHVIDVDHVDCIDFGTGNDAYKSDWMDHCAPLMRIRAFNPSRLTGLSGASRTLLSTLAARISGR